MIDPLAKLNDSINDLSDEHKADLAEYVKDYISYTKMDLHPLLQSSLPKVILNTNTAIKEFVFGCAESQSVTLISHLLERVHRVSTNKNTGYYAYDTKSKLWLVKDESLFISDLRKWIGQLTSSLVAKKKSVFAEVKPDESDDEDDDDEQVRRIKQKAKKQIKKVQAKAEGNTPDSYVKILKSMQSDSYVKSFLSRAITDLDNPDFMKELNSKSHLLPIRDGKVIDLKTLQVRPRTEADKFSFECPVAFTTNTANAEKYFKSLFANKEEREYVRKCLGYMLTGDIRGRCFFVLYGEAKNGKSTLTNLLCEILGRDRFYQQCGKGVFLKSKADPNSASPDLVALLGKRVAVHNEGKDVDDLDESTLKSVSGDDPVTARSLFQNPITFRITCKLLYTTNFVPKLEAEQAIVDRLRYIFFDNRFDEVDQEQRNFVAAIKDTHLDEVFSWIALGAKQYYEAPHIVMPESFQKRTTKLIARADSIECFIKERLTFTGSKDNRIRKTELGASYEEFCVDNGLQPLRLQSLYTRLQAAPHRALLKMLNGYDTFSGIICGKPKKQKKKIDLAAIDSAYQEEESDDDFEFIMTRDEIEMYDSPKRGRNSLGTKVGKSTAIADYLEDF
ncbi:TPA_asm: S3H [Capsaspora MELD virus 2]|nr:TPA_asm: S3H [Capsaspora MELD virus 2]